MLRKCEVCGKEFKPTWFQRTHGYGRFCSSSCYGTYLSNTRRGENSRSWKGGKISVACKECGARIYLHKYQLIDTGNFCSRKCKGAWMSLHTTGINSPSWKGGVSDMRDSVRLSGKYKTWRRKVFNRDRFSCVRCGDSTSGNIEAHHIVRFLLLINEAKIKFPSYSWRRACTEYAPLWMVSNGITLCKKCHAEEHGRTNGV